MGDDGEPQLGLEDAYGVDGPDGNRKLYAAWASTYDTDFIAKTRYIYHRQVAEILSQGLTDPQGPVLDVGCGTGIVGVVLRALGIHTIDGLDISPEMLDQARSKAHEGATVYRLLIEADLTGQIDVPSDTYAGIISAGAFTHGHLGPDSLAELLRVARPGALCVVGINSAHFREFGFGERLDQLAGNGTIHGYELTEVPIYADAYPKNADHFALVASFTAAHLSPSEVVV